MGGQDGYATDPLSYDTENGILMAGLTIKPSKTFKIGTDITYAQSEAGLNPFDLSAPDYVAITPPMSYDFTYSHTYSDLDITRLDWDLYTKIYFSKDFWMFLKYRIVDFNDDAPYMYDTTGKVQFLTGALGWTF